MGLSVIFLNHGQCLLHIAEDHSVCATIAVKESRSLVLPESALGHDQHYQQVFCQVKHNVVQLLSKNCERLNGLS